MALSDIAFEAHAQIREYVAASPLDYVRYTRQIEAALSALDRLRARLDTPPRPDGIDEVPIADVLAHDMELRTRGNALIGRCPIHLENTPSFIVFPAENWYHCLGCAQEGDSIDFRMRMHGETFDQAVRFVRSLADAKL